LVFKVLFPFKPREGEICGRQGGMDMREMLAVEELFHCFGDGNPQIIKI